MIQSQSRRHSPRWARATCGCLAATLILFSIMVSPERVLALEPCTDRFVWVFGWDLSSDQNVAEISRVLRDAGQHGLNGAVFSFGLDALSQQSPDYFRRLNEIEQQCQQNHLELIPAIFSIGYGGGFLSHNRNLAEGLPVVDAPFVVHGGKGMLADSNSVSLVNGGFESHIGNQISGFDFCDQPGQVAFVDTQIKHAGAASLRLESFTTNPYGHGRVMQTVKVIPQRCYRVALWVKTQDLQPANAFNLLALADDRTIAPRDFHLEPTADWREISMLVNSLDHDRIHLYAGMWGGKAGKLWLDDWSIEEAGPVNVLHRPGTPVTVRNGDGSITYVEGKDYGTLQDPNFSPWHDDGDAIPLRILPVGRIQEGDRLRVSWYHSMLVGDSQVTVCMAEPEIYQIMDQEIKLLAEKFHPHRLLLNMDEVRMGGTCRACQGQDMGELIGHCVTREDEIIHKYLPDARVYVWADMFDPHHNAHGNYYLVAGDYTNSWLHVPKDVVMAVWGDKPDEQSLRFFGDQGFETLGACYYDANDLNDVTGWIKLARTVPRVRGLMYTPWEKKYALLPAFGDLLR